MSNLRPYGHHTVTPSFIAPGAKEVIRFLENVFGAKVLDKYEAPGGKLAHAEVLIVDTVIMCADPMPGWDPTPGIFSFYAADGKAVDATYARALEAGATSVEAPKDQPWGYRSATVKDMGGNRWTICAVVEVVAPDEIARRMEKLMKG